MTRPPRKKTVRGKFFWKYEWYSICSVHYNHDPNCNMCTTGHWVNVWGHFFSGIVYKICPPIWRFFINLPPKKKNFWDNFDKLTNY